VTGGIVVAWATHKKKGRNDGYWWLGQLSSTLPFWFAVMVSMASRHSPTSLILTLSVE